MKLTRRTFFGVLAAGALAGIAALLPREKVVVEAIEKKPEPQPELLTFKGVPIIWDNGARYEQKPAMLVHPEAWEESLNAEVNKILLEAHEAEFAGLFKADSARLERWGIHA
jgi:hypothetical protein